MKQIQILKTGITIFLIIAFFVLVNRTPADQVIKNFFYLISSPIQNILWEGGVRLSAFFEIISEMQNFQKENEGLKLKIKELLSENIQIAELKKENEVLREAFEIGLKEEFKLEIAKTSGKYISQDTVLINKGSRDGLTENLPVITQQRVLVGKIVQVYSNFSEVALISKKENTLDVKIQDKDLEGVIRGKGNLKLFLELVPKEKEIESGNLIVTTSLSKTFPEGLLVGQITEVIRSDIEPFQTAEAKTIFDIQELEYLFVITSF